MEILAPRITGIQTLDLVKTPLANIRLNIAVETSRAEAILAQKVRDARQQMLETPLSAQDFLGIFLDVKI